MMLQGWGLLPRLHPREQGDVERARAASTETCDDRRDRQAGQCTTDEQVFLKHDDVGLAAASTSSEQVLLSPAVMLEPVVREQTCTYVHVDKVVLLADQPPGGVLKGDAAQGELLLQHQGLSSVGGDDDLIRFRTGSSTNTTSERNGARNMRSEVNDR